MRQKHTIRYLIITRNETILYEFTDCRHLAEGYDTISEVRLSNTASFVAAGQDIRKTERKWAAEMADTITRLVGTKPVVVMAR